MATCRTLEKRRISLINLRIKRLDKQGSKYLKTKQFQKDRALNISIIREQRKKHCK